MAPETEAEFLLRMKLEKEKYDANPTDYSVACRMPYVMQPDIWETESEGCDTDTDPEEEEEEERVEAAETPVQIDRTVKLFGIDTKLYLHNLNFSSKVIDRFVRRLFGKEERCMKKLVHFCVSTSAHNMFWLSVNPHNPKGKTNKVFVPIVNQDIMSPESDFSPELQYLTSYGCTVGGKESSKIIIAGGKYKGVPSNKIFMYDTIFKTWEQPLQMRVPRGENPIVVFVDENIYVFGGIPEYYYPDHDPEKLPQPWAEWVEQRQSDILYRIPKVIILTQQKILTHAVYPKRRLILFFLDQSGFYSFNYFHVYWEYHPNTFVKDLRWSTTVVVFGDFLFWHHSGTIYLRNLLNDATIPMFTVPYHRNKSSVLFNADDPPPAILVHIGKGKLCLFYLAGNRIRYITLLVQISHGIGATIPRLVAGHSGHLSNTRISAIHHALEVSS